MASTLNAAINGLLAQLAASPDLAGVTVHDGPPMAAETPDWVAIGYQPGQTESASMTYDWAQIGGQRSEERYDLLCTLATTSGDTTLSVGRARAVALRDAVAAAITTDRTLGGAVRLAHMSAAALHQEQTSQGMVVGFSFTVAIQARITT